MKQIIIRVIPFVFIGLLMGSVFTAIILMK